MSSNPSGGGGDKKLYKTHEGEHHGDYSDTALKITRSTYIYAICAAINSCNLGYDIGVNTNAGPILEEDLQLSHF